MKIPSTRQIKHDELLELLKHLISWSILDREGKQCIFVRHWGPDNTRLRSVGYFMGVDNGKLLLTSSYNFDDGAHVVYQAISLSEVETIQEIN